MQRAHGGGERDKSGKRGLAKAFRAFALFGSFGFVMAACVLIGYFVGHYLDEKLGTEPWLLLVSLLLAIVGAFAEFFKTFQRFMRLESGRSEGETKAPDPL